ncbi:hypothetical protein [Leifsonia sp. Le1]|uniref:hypothetical protein n=1 Tax=Leifsonia sp. Le1 TaxID=3404918 RepID=UPI003EB7334A
MYTLKRNILASSLGLSVAVALFVAMMWVNGNFTIAVAAGVSLAVGLAVFCSIAVRRSRRTERPHPRDLA